MRHGPSAAWTTACIASTLSEFEKAPEGLLKTILKLQHEDGGWFRIPRPHKMSDDITGDEEIIEDKNRLFSTAAAIIALARQKKVFHNQDFLSQTIHSDVNTKPLLL